MVTTVNNDYIFITKVARNLWWNTNQVWQSCYFNHAQIRRPRWAIDPTQHRSFKGLTLFEYRKKALTCHQAQRPFKSNHFLTYVCSTQIIRFINYFFWLSSFIGQNSVGLFKTTLGRWSRARSEELWIRTVSIVKMFTNNVWLFSKKHLFATLGNKNQTNYMPFQRLFVLIQVICTSWLFVYCSSFEIPLLNVITKS